MTSSGQSGGVANGEEDIYGGLIDPFRGVARNVLRIPEILRLQDQQVERRIQAILHLQEQRTALAVKQLERERDDAVRALREELQGRIKKLEDRMIVLEGRPGSSVGREGIAAGKRKRRDMEEETGPGTGCDATETGEQGSIKQLKNRIDALETSVERTLCEMFPRVDALVTQLEGASPPEAPCAPPSTSSSSALGATGGAAASARPGPVHEERQKQRVETRLWEVWAKRDRAQADPNPLGEDLCKAAQNGWLEKVGRLIDYCADVNYVDSGGDTPLTAAVRGDEPSPRMMSLLLEKGAEVNAFDADGRSVLHLAACSEHSGACVARLVVAGADVNARDEDGATPLHWAAYGNNEAAVCTLLAAGARTDIRCWTGWYDKTPLQMTASDTIRELLGS